MAVEWIALHVTDRCQLDCSHCLRDPEQKPKDLPVSLIRAVLTEAKRDYRALHAAFSGGEPTLHPEFAAIVDVAVELGYTWHMVSNGKRFPWLVDLFREDPRRQQAMTSVTFSLDGATESTHDAIRGHGSYRDVMTAVSLCTALGISFVLQGTLHAKNIAEIEALGLLASQLGAARLSLVMMQPTGTRHDQDHYLSASAWKGVKDRIDRLAAALTLPVTMPEGFFKEQPLHVCQPFASQQLHVTVEGRLNLCCQHAGIPSDGIKSDEAGDLHTMPLAQAHVRLLDIIHNAQREKVQALHGGTLDDEWDRFPCNHCMKSFGKPHWTSDGVGGPPAARQRWRGAWKNVVRLPLVPS